MNSGSALTSTGGTGFEQFLCGVLLEKEGTDHGESADGSVSWSKVLLTANYSEGDPDKLSFSGETYTAPVYTGQA